MDIRRVFQAVDLTLFTIMELLEAKRRELVARRHLFEAKKAKYHAPRLAIASLRERVEKLEGAPVRVAQTFAEDLKRYADGRLGECFRLIDGLEGRWMGIDPAIPGSEVTITKVPENLGWVILDPEDTEEKSRFLAIANDSSLPYSWTGPAQAVTWSTREEAEDVLKSLRTHDQTQPHPWLIVHRCVVRGFDTVRRELLPDAAKPPFRVRTAPAKQLGGGLFVRETGHRMHYVEETGAATGWLAKNDALEVFSRHKFQAGSYEIVDGEGKVVGRHTVLLNRTEIPARSGIPEL